jgi:hypothetical protein
MKKKQVEMSILLFEKIEKLAAKDKRSVNKQIEVLLTEAVDKRGKK